MRGLLLKDLYMTWEYCRVFILIVAIFLGVSFFSGNTVFFIMYPVIISSMVPITLMAYEERSGWNKYSDTFPYSRAQIVSAKYLTALIVSSCVIVLSVAVQALQAAAGRTSGMSSYFSTITLLLSIGLLGPSLTLPFSFKFGTEKGRILYIAVIILFCVLFNMSSGFSLQQPQQGVSSLPLFTCLGSLFIFALSWALSIRIYQNREL